MFGASRLSLAAAFQGRLWLRDFRQDGCAMCAIEHNKVRRLAERCCNLAGASASAGRSPSERRPADLRHIGIKIGHANNEQSPKG